MLLIKFLKVLYKQWSCITYWCMDVWGYDSDCVYSSYVHLNQTEENQFNLDTSKDKESEVVDGANRTSIKIDLLLQPAYFFVCSPLEQTNCFIRIVILVECVLPSREPDKKNEQAYPNEKFFICNRYWFKKLVKHDDFSTSQVQNDTNTPLGLLACRLPNKQSTLGPWAVWWSSQYQS